MTENELIQLIDAQIAEDTQNLFNNDDDSISFKDLMKSRMVMHSLLFMAGAKESSDIKDISQLINIIDANIETYFTSGDAKPLQKLTSTTSKAIQSDKLSRMFLAFVYFCIADKYFSLKDHYEGLKYYERGITYCNLKDFDDMKKDILSKAPKPIQIHTNARKEIAIPLAKKIWSYDKDTNLLMRIQVAALVVDLLPHLGLTIPQVDNWLKKSGEVPPDILKRYAIKDYGNTREENKLRTQLTSKIISDLSPIDCRGL